MQVIRPSDTSDSLGPAGLGSVPTLGGNVATAVPDPITGVSAVQTQQGTTTVVQNAAQAIVLPPPPYAVLQQMDPSGALGTWFQTLNRKLGGYSTVYLATVAITAPISGDGTAAHPLAMAAATATVPGYLLSADWSTFNAKVPPSRQVATTAPITGGGDLSADRTISMPAATTTVDGYLAHGDWNTFNGKQAALGFTPVDKAGDTGLGAMSMTSVRVTSAGGFISSDGSPGYTGTVTTSSLVGKTITIKDGIITGFA